MLPSGETISVACVGKQNSLDLLHESATGMKKNRVKNGITSRVKTCGGLRALSSSARLAVFLLCGLLTSNGAAAAEPRWFTIELIVFKQWVAPNYAEHWPTNVVLGYPENLIRFPSESRNNSQPDSFQETDFNGSLLAIRDTLAQKRGQRVLYSRRWHQGLLDKESAPHLYIYGGEKTGSNHELEGSIQISVERYLHVKSNLWLSKFGSGDGAAAGSNASAALENTAATFDDEFSDGFDEAPIRLPGPPFARLGQSAGQAPVETVYLSNQDRRLRSKETHYIDHPALGIVIRIEPLDSQPSAAY